MKKEEEIASSFSPQRMRQKRIVTLPDCKQKLHENKRTFSQEEGTISWRVNYCTSFFPSMKAGGKHSIGMKSLGEKVAFVCQFGFFSWKEPDVKQRHEWVTQCDNNNWKKQHFLLLKQEAGENTFTRHTKSTSLLSPFPPSPSFVTTGKERRETLSCLVLNRPLPPFFFCAVLLLSQQQQPRKKESQRIRSSRCSFVFCNSSHVDKKRRRFFPSFPVASMEFHLRFCFLLSLASWPRKRRKKNPQKRIHPWPFFLLHQLENRTTNIYLSFLILYSREVIKKGQL